MPRSGPPRPLACLAALALLAACGAPDFDGVRPAQVRVDGFNLDVYRKGAAFQVVKVTNNYRSESDFAYTALLTAERVTGCVVRRRTVRGGPTRITGRLDC